MTRLFFFILLQSGYMSTIVNCQMTSIVSIIILNPTNLLQYELLANSKVKSLSSARLCPDELAQNPSSHRVTQTLQAHP